MKNSERGSEKREWEMSETVTVRLPREAKRRLIEESKRMGLTTSAFIRMHLFRLLGKEGDQK